MALIKQEEREPNHFTAPFAGLFSSIPLRFVMSEDSYLLTSMLTLTLSITMTFLQNTMNEKNVPTENLSKTRSVLFLVGITMGLMVPTDAVQNIIPSI